MNIKLIISALAVVGLFACGGGKKEAEEPTEETPAAEPEPAPEPEAPAEGGGAGGGAAAPGTGGGAAAEPKN